MGTRPEIIKMAPIILELDRRHLPFNVVFSGQHYDYELSMVFFEELGLPKPKVDLHIAHGTQIEQTAHVMVSMEHALASSPPKLVLVQGDTTTVLGAAVAANKMHIPVGHVEAGLRSYDYRLPEEINRRMTDHLSSFLFAPTEHSKEILEGEHVWGKVHVTGNTVIDSLERFVPIAMKKSKILDGLPFDKFALLTAHRGENVDDPEILSKLVDIIEGSPIPIVFPVHPRTSMRLMTQGLMTRLQKVKHLKLLPPVGYFDMLVLLKSCSLVLSDSGGLQEEVTAPSIGKFILVLRTSTERPEAVDAGYAKVMGFDKEAIFKDMERSLDKGRPSQKHPYGIGDAANKIINVIEEFLTNIYL